MLHRYYSEMFVRYEVTKFCPSSLVIFSIYKFSAISMSYSQDRDLFPPSIHQQSITVTMSLTCLVLHIKWIASGMSYRRSYTKGSGEKSMTRPGSIHRVYLYIILYFHILQFMLSTSLVQGNLPPLWWKRWYCLQKV